MSRCWNTVHGTTRHRGWFLIHPHLQQNPSPQYCISPQHLQLRSRRPKRHLGNGPKLLEDSEPLSSSELTNQVPPPFPLPLLYRKVFGSGDVPPCPLPSGWRVMRRRGRSAWSVVQEVVVQDPESWCQQDLLRVAQGLALYLRFIPLVFWNLKCRGASRGSSSCRPSSLLRRWHPAPSP